MSVLPLNANDLHISVEWKKGRILGFLLQGDEQVSYKPIRGPEFEKIWRYSFLYFTLSEHIFKVPLKPSP